MRLQRRVWQTTVEITSCTQELAWRAQSCNIREKKIYKERSYTTGNRLSIWIIRGVNCHYLETREERQPQCLFACLASVSARVGLKPEYHVNTKSSLSDEIIDVCFLLFFFSVRKQAAGYSTKFCRHQSTGPWQDQRCDLKGWTSGQGQAVCVCAVSWNKCFLSFKACIFKECILSFRP